MNDIYTKKSIGLIHKIYFIQLKNKKRYTASTKTKSEVRGGGRKPWRQKGTGQARAGSSRSPIWVGGGVSFGPKPHLVSKKANKKEKELARTLALNLKRNVMKVFDENLINLNVQKTSQLVKILENFELNISSKKILIITSEKSKSLTLASQNLKNISITDITTFSLQELLNADFILLSKNTLTLLDKKYGKSNI